MVRVKASTEQQYLLYHHDCVLHRRLLVRGYCYSRTRCFHCLCIFSGIWITIPPWLWICWPNEPAWLIDTRDHHRSHSSSPVLNKHWMFHPPNVCSLMNRFNLVGNTFLYKLTRGSQCLINFSCIKSTWQGNFFKNTKLSSLSRFMKELILLWNHWWQNKLKMEKCYLSKK